MHHSFFKKAFLSAIILCASLFFNSSVNAQMRQVYLDNITPGNQINKISFYNNTSGFVAFRDWIGFSSDSGRTFTQKNITNGNTNLNGFNVNFLFGFGINGVKAFDQNNIIAYGDYGFVPAILKSTDGGNTFTVRYHSQFNSLELRTGITDIIFPQNNGIGYAVDADRVLKTTNQGLNWSVVKIDPARYFTNLEAVDNNVVFAISTKFETNKVYRTVNAGISWQDLPLPVGVAAKVRSLFFLDFSTGWINMYDNDNHDFVYKTTDAGLNWVLQNNVYAHSVSLGKFKFTDANVGFGLSFQNKVLKTLNGGGIWEALPRDNNFTYLEYSHNDLQCNTSNQLWAGGGHGFLEISNNGGGTPIPQAYFLIDTVGVSATNNVNLTNYSRTGYTYKWYKNNTYIGNTFNANYIHNVNSYLDSIKLVVFNGVRSDSTTKYQYFNVPAPPLPTITSFNPLIGNTGNTINIYGTNFIGVSAVKFGGVNATSFTVISPTQITAILDSGASGFVKITTPFGSDSLIGFQHLRPTITSFSPTSGGPGSVITINGSGFTNGGGTFTPLLNFGGTSASSFVFTNTTSMNAVVGNGASGNITFTTIYGTATIAGFTYIPPPAPPSINSFAPMQAAQGNTVTITGTSFINVTGVKFGSTAAASFIVVSPTSITAVVGAGSSGRVFVTTGTGTDSLAGFVYTTPIISNISPSVGSTGTVVNINGSNFNGTTSVTFGGTAASSFVINSSTSITAIVGNGSTGIVTITSPNGTVSGSNFLFVPNNVPIINSFSPTTGIVGSTVQIIGTGFSNIPTNNIVYFGATKAVVTSSSTTSLSVVVPLGANYNNINVTVNGLTCTSNKGFVVNFPNGLLTSNTYSTKLELATKLNPRNNFIVDLDVDGKPDIILISDDTISVFRNISSLNNYNFESRVDFPLIGIFSRFKIADMNGDGRKDIIYQKGDSLYILINSSTIGTISFSASTVRVFVSNNNGIDVGDFNNDGKIDIAILKSWVEIFQNNSVGGIISFANGVIVTPIINPNSVMSFIVNDLDGDGKQDIAVSNTYTPGISSISNSAVTIYRNTFNGNNISFSEITNYGTSGIYFNINSGDIDNDGKLDLFFGIFGYYNYLNNTITQTNKIGILRNISSVGLMNFSLQDFASSNSGGSITNSIGDVDGDQKPDIISFDISDEFNVLKNISTIGNINYNGPLRFTTNSGLNTNISVCDMNEDSKPEIVICGISTNKVYIFKNKDSAVSVNVCANSNKIINSNIAGSNYQWQVNTGSGFINITDGVNYSGTNTHDLQITNTPISFNNNKYKCLVGSNSSSVFILTVNPIIIPTINLINNDTTICASSSITFTTNSSNAGINPIYQWQVNGVNTGINSPTFITNSLTNNSQIKCILTSTELCAIPPTITSNIVNVSVNPVIVPTVSIAASATNICSAISINFTATSTNSGTTPIYQWQVNGVNVGTNSNTFTTNSLTNNAQVKCILTNSATCVSPQTVLSNVLNITVNPILTPSVTISTASSTICVGSSTTFTANATNGGTTPTYQWQVNGVNIGTNSPTFTSSTLNNNDQVKCILTSNGNCVSPQIVTSNTIIVSVNTAVVPSVLIISSATTICAGSPITFTATPTNGGAAPSYQWQVNGVNAGTNSNIFTTSTLTNASVVKIVMTSSLACAVPQNSTSNSINIIVNNTVTPTATFTSSATSICSGASITFTSTSTNVGTVPIYQWKRNGINVGANSATYTSNGFVNGDAITLTLTSNATCASNIPVVSSPVIITVSTAIPAISIAGNTTVIVNNSTNITSSTSFGGTTPSYQWQDSTNLHNWANISGANNSSLLYSPTASGNKLRGLMTSNATCSPGILAYSNVLTFDVTPSIVAPNPTGPYTLRYFPNPVHSILTIDSLQLSKEWESLKIITPEGLVYKTLINYLVGKTKVIVNVDELLPSVYFLILTRKQGVPVFLKFVKL